MSEITILAALAMISLPITVKIVLNFVKETQHVNGVPILLQIKQIEAELKAAEMKHESEMADRQLNEQMLFHKQLENEAANQDILG